jgi:hypothetical protein
LGALYAVRPTFMKSTPGQKNLGLSGYHFGALASK